MQMFGVWKAAKVGDLAMVERRLKEKPGEINKMDHSKVNEHDNSKCAKGMVYNESLFGFSNAIVMFNDIIITFFFNIGRQKRSALHYAAEAGHDDVVKFLVLKGVSVLVHDKKHEVQSNIGRFRYLISPIIYTYLVFLVGSAIGSFS